jgi:hypothetical protein
MAANNLFCFALYACQGAEEGADCGRGHRHGRARGAAHRNWLLKSRRSCSDDRRQREPHVHVQRAAGNHFPAFLCQCRPADAQQMHPRACIVCDEDATLDLRVRTVR